VKLYTLGILFLIFWNEGIYKKGTYSNTEYVPFY